MGIRHPQALSPTKTSPQKNLAPGRAAVFLDRDGTLNVPVVRDGKPYPPASPAEFNLYAGVSEGCLQLKAAGFILVVATNQPDVGRGTQSKTAVEDMHARLRELVPSIDHIEVSYDAGNEAVPSPRRKPAPGMLVDAAQTLSIDLTRSWMVGDRWRDIDCGRAAGCRTVFIDLGYSEQLRSPPDFVVKDFAAAVGIILAHHLALPVH